jgi:hypothetical protein
MASRRSPPPEDSPNTTLAKIPAFAELGKAAKTLFLCRYLHSEALRREIHEGLNVIEQSNGANDFGVISRASPTMAFYELGIRGRLAAPWAP